MSRSRLTSCAAACAISAAASSSAEALFWMYTAIRNQHHIAILPAYQQQVSCLACCTG